MLERYVPFTDGFEVKEIEQLEHIRSCARSHLRMCPGDVQTSQLGGRWPRVLLVVLERVAQICGETCSVCLLLILNTLLETCSTNC